MYDLEIFPDTVARTPRHLGVNIELQDHHDEVNLWDWLADSGVTIVREFHPEQSLRKGEVSHDTWETVTTRAELEAFRKRVRADPEGDMIQWQAYRFDRPVHWIGVPDGIIRKVSELGVEPLVSMGYQTKSFPRPLVKDRDLRGVPGDDGIDWPAAASAYEYYFAMIYHFASKFGSRYFLMHNEPECCLDSWYLPEDLEAMEEHPCSTPEGRKRTRTAVDTQWGVLAGIARMALDDVRGLVGEDDGPFFLAGPVSGAWMGFWRNGGKYLDSLDYHHYHPNPAAFEALHRATAAVAGKDGKRLSSSEFNVKPGNIPFKEILFEHGAAITQACMLVRALQMSRPGDPVYEFMTLYLFPFPATHRNQKSLLYGDMNMLDWTTQDIGLVNRSEEWYPTLEEQQMRFPTPAYHIFRMLARCMPGGSGNPDGNAVLRSGTECLIDDAHGGAEASLTPLIIDAGDTMFLNVLNPSHTPLRVPVNLARVRERFRFAVVRVTAFGTADMVQCQLPLVEDRIEVNVPHQSLTQVILTTEPLDEIKKLEFIEKTTTPGTIDQLDLLQTTRLRAMATIDGRQVDVTCLNVIWKSSDPFVVNVHQGGLVQRVRDSARDVTITAGTPDGVETAVVVKGNNCSR